MVTIIACNEYKYKPIIGNSGSYDLIYDKCCQKLVDLRIVINIIIGCEVMINLIIRK